VTQILDPSGIAATARGASGRRLDEELELSARRSPDDAALWTPGQGELTFARWAEAVAECADRLAEAGVRARRRIALKFDSTDVLGLAVAQLAVQALRASALVLPADVSTSTERSALRTTRAALLIRSGSRWDHPVLERLPSTGSPAEATDGEALILLTSGSTGEPRLVPVSHAELTFSPAAGLGHEAKAPRDKSIVHSFVAGTNAYHDYLSRAVLGQLYVHVVPGADPAELWRTVTEREVPRLGLSPVAARWFVDWILAGHHDGRMIERVGLTGSAIDGALVRRLRTAFPNAHLLGVYGLTEGGGGFTFATDLSEDGVGLLGEPRPGLEARVVDESGTPQPSGTPGVLELRCTDRPARGVIGDSSPADWLVTGDVAVIDARGAVRLVDRVSDMVKVADRRVSSLTAEAVLLAHPAVADAAVVGVPDPVIGTRLVAAVVAREPIEPASLREFAAERLSPPETPTRVTLLDELPMTPSGKHDKPRLRAQLASMPANRGEVGPLDLRMIVTRAWDDVFGAPDDDRDFFAQGGSSQQAAELLALIRERCGISIAPVDLLSTGTAQALISAVEAAAAGPTAD